MTLHANNLNLSSPAGQPRLDQLSLQVRPSEIHALIGPNGAGKSTLLAALSGRIRAQSGEVYLAGRRLEDFSDQARAQQLAVLPQQSNLDFSFRVEQVVALGRYPHQSSQAVNERIIEAALARCDLLPLMGRSINELSGGERQRVHLARVFAQIWPEADAKDRFLLLDEPATGLDLHHQHQLYRAIKGFAQQGIGILWVIHDLNIAAEYGQRISLIHRGHIRHSGEASTVLNTNNIAECFGLTVDVITHPHHGGPLILPITQGG